MFKQVWRLCQFEHLIFRIYHLILWTTPEHVPRLRSTTVLLVHRDGNVAMAGDGQVTLGETIIKGNARKIRRLASGEILGRFCGCDRGRIFALDPF
jgi:ATP-dependent HslUV protease subunit HslV